MKEKRPTNTDTRKRKAVEAMITAECDRTGTDISIEENRAAIASRVLNALERPKKDRKVEEEGHARVTQTVGGTKLFYGAMDSAFRRKYGADDSLYMWNRFKQHHNFGESQTEEAKKLALSSSKRCDWATIAARIARDEPLKYGARHPCGPISRQGLMKLVQSAVRDATEVFVGRRRTLPENAINSIVSTLRKMLATHAALWTVPLLRPVAIITVEGCSHYLTEGGKGNFTCSKWWLSHIFREQKWSYRKLGFFFCMFQLGVHLWPSQTMLE